MEKFQVKLSINPLKGESRMSEVNNITKRSQFQHLTQFQRGEFQAILKLNVPKIQIAKKVGVSRSTLYEELKRGTVKQINSDLSRGLHGIC